MTNPKTVSRRLTVTLCIVIALVTYAVYFQVTQFEFVNLDTPHYVYANPQVRSGLSWDSIKWSFHATEVSNWHPVTWISHLVDVELYGIQPGAHHHTSLIIHIVNTLLLFLFLNRATGFLWRGAFVASLFALHPLHVESVVWVAERKDVLCGFFFLLCLLAYHRFVTTGQFKWYAGTLLGFGLGLMAKPMIVTLPFLLFVLDYWPFKRYGALRTSAGASTGSNHTGGFKLVAEKIPLILMSMGMSGLIIRIQKASGAITPVDSLSLSERVFNAFSSYALYLKDTIWPLDLCIYYPLTGKGPTAAQFAGAAALIFLSVLAVLYRKRFRWVLSGWLWYLGMLVPVIGIVQTGAQSRADRYTYLPLIGIFIVVAWCLAKIAERSKVYRFSTAVAAILIILLVIPVTVKQIGYWENSETLYQRALGVTQKNGFCHYNLGVALYEQKRFKEASQHLISALAINRADSKSHNMLGLCLMQTGELDRAVDAFQEAVLLNPHFVGASLNLASAHKGRGHPEEAVKIYRQALKTNPNHPGLHNNLATTLIVFGDVRDAIWHFEAALDNDPGQTHSKRNLDLTRQIEKELIGILDAGLKSANPEEQSGHVDEDLLTRIESVFRKYNVKISRADLEKLAGSWDAFPSDKEKNVP